MFLVKVCGSSSRVLPILARFVVGLKESGSVTCFAGRSLLGPARVSLGLFLDCTIISCKVSVEKVSPLSETQLPSDCLKNVSCPLFTLEPGLALSRLLKEVALFLIAFLELGVAICLSEVKVEARDRALSLRILRS